MRTRVAGALFVLALPLLAHAGGETGRIHRHKSAPGKRRSINEKTPPCVPVTPTCALSFYTGRLFNPRPPPAAAPPRASAAELTHVALAVEGSFFPATLAVVASLIDHAENPHLLHIHIYSDCRSAPTLKEQIQSFWCGYESRGAILTLHEINAARFALTKRGCPQNCARGIFANYLRFYLPELLPNVDKILWVDADGLVLGDVVPFMRGLFAGTMAQRSLAAVLRLNKHLMQSTGLTLPALARAGLHGVQHDDPSFNAGLVALNLREWRAKDLTRRIEIVVMQLKAMNLSGFSGMSTVEDSQTPMALLLINRSRSEPIDIEPLDLGWNVDGLGWRCVANTTICNGNYLHWSGKHKPWFENSTRSLYRDLWQPYDDFVKRIQRGASAQCPAHRVVPVETITPGQGAASTCRETTRDVLLPGSDVPSLKG
mmetsp:Transcript_27077/g.91183  ORF Transcript_27077/g.91183 Transcript_27077/m.91183 type:complete len:429 (+) Transcript_27077:105-1391(+)